MKHLEVSCGIIIRDQQVLCVQRNIGKYDDVSLKWEFPGGKLEAEKMRNKHYAENFSKNLDIDIDKDL